MKLMGKSTSNLIAITIWVTLAGKDTSNFREILRV